MRDKLGHWTSHDGADLFGQKQEERKETGVIGVNGWIFKIFIFFITYKLNL